VVHRARFNQIDTQLETINIQVTEHSHHDEQERISRLSLHAEDPDEHHEHDVTHHPNAERHEFVKRGTHKDEMDIADYVIAGVFKSRENARHFADGIDKMGFQADFGHLTEKGLWYVYIYESQNIEEARAERDRFRKMKMFRDAWLLTVHH
jgi:hypothetical protein